jgi:peroxiredoxin
VQLGELQRSLDKFRSRGASVVAMSVDSPSDSAALAAERGLTFPLLSDRGFSSIRAHGVEDAENGIVSPAIFIVGCDGRIAWRSLSDTYKAQAAPEEILRALDALPPPSARPHENR